MKKFLTFTLALAMLLVTALPALAVEEQEENIESLTSTCSHGIYHYDVESIGYDGCDEDGHYYAYWLYKYCSKCDTLISKSRERDFSTHTYPSGYYWYSIHSGEYTTHKYVYRRNCTEANCTWYTTREVSAICTATRCVDPA